MKERAIEKQKTILLKTIINSLYGRMGTNPEIKKTLLFNSKEKEEVENFI